MKGALHHDQLDVSIEIVQALVREQFPQWRDLPIDRVHGLGTVNAIFRIGERYAARLPLRGRDPDAIRRLLGAEARAARALAAATRCPVPQPLAIGEPGTAYPLPWSIQTWLPGTVAADADPAGSSLFARDLANLIAELRVAGTGGRAFAGRGRGGELQHQDPWMAECFARSEALLDVPRLRRQWAEFRLLPRGYEPDVMNHGDLTPANLLVGDGGLVGILDAGGFAPADPALDLVAAWHLLDADRRLLLKADLGCGEAEWKRGRAWAFAQAMGLVWYYENISPRLAQIGRRTLERVIGDEVT
jgi:aminoglycoside phosphotransferase (APT) family kinase protein